MITFEAHTHTNFSDGSNYKRVIDAAVRKGIDVLAITDHNRLGIKKTSSYAKNFYANKILIMPAEEISTRKGEVLAYGIQEEIKKTDSLLETLENIYSQGGIAFVPHPFHPVLGLVRTLGLGAFDDTLFTGVEAFNYLLPKPLNVMAERLADHYGLVKLCGSDAHFSTDVGKLINELPCEKNLDDVLISLKKGEGKYESMKSANPLELFMYLINYAMHFRFRFMRF
jgi:predicted metal-dependent phosphoesterase TrpH